MAKEISVHGPHVIGHLKGCHLHGPEAMAMCSASLKRKGGKCVNKAIGPLDGMMPTCRVHRDQVPQSAWCRAPLPCGFECGRICIWRPHGFQLCPDHYEHPMTCYLLKIPIEMRLRIFGYLLPDGPVPAQYRGSRCLTSNGEPVCTALLRVNHQIHDETARLLYSVNPFTIELVGDSLAMCNSPKRQIPFPPGPPPGPGPGPPPGAPSFANHAHRDYSMQLMLLEQQNKKRLMMARQQQDRLMELANNGSSSSSHTPAANIPNYFNRPGRGADISYTCGPAEPAWDPPLNLKYFNMIQSFRVEIVFPAPTHEFATVVGRPRPPPPPPLPPDLRAKGFAKRLHSYCDHLHKLIGRFRLLPRPLARLDVVIGLNLGGTVMNLEEAISAAQVLLRPFQRLRSVSIPEVPLILINNFENQEVKLLNNPLWASLVSELHFDDYLNSWLSDVSSPDPSFDPPVFKAYWQLEQLMSNIRCNIRDHYSDTSFQLFAELLHTARVAREVDDLPSFRAVWDTVLNIWFDYVNNQRLFQSNVSLSIDAIDSTIKDD